MYAGHDAPNTGAPSNSASATTASLAPDEKISSPAITASLPGAIAARASPSSSSPAATAARSIRDDAPTGVRVVRSMTSIGNDRNTGPLGAAMLSCSARRTSTGSWSGCSTSCAHFTDGAAMRTRSPDNSGAVWLWRVSCWPAVTTSGAPEICALSSAPIAWPSPPAVWRLTKPGRPDACA